MQSPKKIAVVTTIYRYLSHAQHFVDRFLVGYPYEGQWHRPNTKVVSLYIDHGPRTFLHVQFDRRNFIAPLYKRRSSKITSG